ncbi:MAG: hypothetical protein FJW39_21560 [Acidobacteria bacterium]|nr:hypothetical protein [Acidobacteriota bacterium]
MTRRNALLAPASALLAASAKGAPCNFQSSYMTWDVPPRKDPRPYARHNTPLGNKARIQLDAIVDVTDVRGNATERYVLIAPCRTEWVYADKGLFQIPSREYCNIYSLKEERSMLSAITYDGEVSAGRAIGSQFRSLKIDVKQFARFRELTDRAAINRAIAENVPLVGRTVLEDPVRGERYSLEYPIRTMNFRPENGSFQVDTGPLLVPDRGSKAGKVIDRLEMAHIAYKTLDQAEFIVRRPTPVTDKAGKELSRTLYYSEIAEWKASTVILAGDAG